MIQSTGHLVPRVLDGLLEGGVDLFRSLHQCRKLLANGVPQAFEGGGRLLRHGILDQASLELPLRGREVLRREAVAVQHLADSRLDHTGGPARHEGLCCNPQRFVNGFRLGMVCHLARPGHVGQRWQ